jgi:integrase
VGEGAQQPRKSGNRKLTDLHIKQFLADYRSEKIARHAKLTDGDGMFLTHTKAGTPVWRMKYRLNGKQKTFSIGEYPAVSLSEARAKREKARQLVKEGRDPTQERRVERAAAEVASATTFEGVATQWLANRREQWSDIHYTKSLRAFQRDVFPALGPLPISKIKPAMVVGVVQAIAKRGAIDTAERVRQHIGGVFRLAQALDLCDYKENPAESVREVLPPKPMPRHYPALLKWAELGDILRKISAAPVSPQVRMALRLMAFAPGLRIGNLVEAEWSEFHLDAEHPVWVIPRPKMKKKLRHFDHKVYLGATITAELRDWREVSGPRGFLFPSNSTAGHITREALEKVLRVTLDLAGKHTPHGWRSAFNTLAMEEGQFDRDVVQLASDRVHDNAVVRAYDRGERLGKRIELMNWWDRELSRAEYGADVVPLLRTA